MWCVAELNEEYIARMEDVLAIYEKPLTAKERGPVWTEKPVVVARRCPFVAAIGRADCAARLRVPAARHQPSLLRRPAQGRTALHQAHNQPLFAAVRRLSGGDRGQLSRCRHHPSGDGQPELSITASAGGPVRREDRRLLWECFTVQLTPNTAVVEPGGDRDQPVLPQCLAEQDPSLGQLQRQHGYGTGK